MSIEWNNNEIDYLLSLPDSELESWIRDLPPTEQEQLVARLLLRSQECRETNHENRETNSSDRETNSSDRETNSSDRETVTSKAKLAPLLGMSVVMLDRYIGYGAKIVGPPYDLEAATTEIERIRRERAESQDQIGPDLRRERMMAELEEKRQSGRAKQLKNDILEGKSYPADEVDQYLAEYASRIKTRLEQFPAEAIAGIPQQWRDTVRTALETAVFELLLEMAGTSYRAQGGYDDDHDND